MELIYDLKRQTVAISHLNIGKYSKHNAQHF